jgi:beta-N-acetylhexosaminidase
MIKKSILLVSITFICGCTTDTVVANEAPKLVMKERIIYTTPQKSLEEKIGSMLMVGFMGTTAPADSQICRDIYKYNLGGVILFDANPINKKEPKNIYSKAQLAQLTQELQSCSRDGKLLIAVDQEGGRVQRLKRKYGFNGRFPKAKSIRGISDSRVAQIYEKMGEELSSVGVNYNLAPVVDLAINRQNRVIYKLGRSFGSNPKDVIKYSKIFINAMHQNGVLTSVKHFPGHGSSFGDTHKGFVDVTKLWNGKKELEPYRVLSRDGVLDTVMVAHVFNRRLDPKYPATLSKKTINGLLRKEIGFDGVVITDDLQMGAITHKYGLRKTLKLAINAGNDLLLFGNQLSVKSMVTTRKLVNTVKNLLKNGEVNISTIEKSNNRLERLKAKI